MVGIVLNIELIISAAKVQQNSEKIVYLHPKISMRTQWRIENYHLHRTDNACVVSTINRMYHLNKAKR